MHRRPTVALLSVVAAAGTAAPAVAQAPPAAAPGTVSAIGSGQVAPEPSNRNDNDAIRRAVEAARRDAIPLAVADARRRATDIAFAGGLTLGGIVAMAEGTAAPYFGYDQSQGTFGPGRFCGNVPRWRTRRAASGRVISRKRIGTRRTCRVPSRIIATVTVTYAASPKAP